MTAAKIAMARMPMLSARYFLSARQRAAAREGELVRASAKEDRAAPPFRTHEVTAPPQRMPPRLPISSARSQQSGHRIKTTWWYETRIALYDSVADGLSASAISAKVTLDAMH